jgi:hypothetical protein
MYEFRKNYLFPVIYQIIYQKVDDFIKKSQLLFFSRKNANQIHFWMKSFLKSLSKKKCLFYKFCMYFKIYWIEKTRNIPHSPKKNEIIPNFKAFPHIFQKFTSLEVERKDLFFFIKKAKKEKFSLFFAFFMKKILILI